MSPISRIPTPLRQRLPQLLIEIVSVVFAVLLALAVNQWRERHAQAALAEEALKKITREVEDNRERLSATLEEQKAELEKLRADLDKLAAADAVQGLSVNLSAESLRDTAWQTTLVTGAVRSMDFETISRLSDVYQLHGLVDRAAERMFVALTSPEIHRDDAGLAPFRHMAATLRQLIELETQLLERYDSFLQRR